MERPAKLDVAAMKCGALLTETQCFAHCLDSIFDRRKMNTFDNVSDANRWLSQFRPDAVQLWSYSPTFCQTVLKVLKGQTEHTTDTMYLVLSMCSHLHLRPGWPTACLRFEIGERTHGRDQMKLLDENIELIFAPAVELWDPIEWKERH